MEFVVWFHSDLWNLLFDFIQIYVVWLNSDVWNLLFDLIQMYGICCLIWNWTSLGVMFWTGEFIQCPFVCFLCVIFSKYICFIVWFDLKRACWQIAVDMLQCVVQNLMLQGFCLLSLFHIALKTPPPSVNTRKGKHDFSFSRQLVCHMSHYEIQFSIKRHLVF